MTAHVPMARVPFAPLDNPRLQHLASAKNRQNGAILAQKSARTGKTNNNMMKMSGGGSSSSSSSSSTSTSTSNKRAYETCAFDEFDSENVDPAIFDSPSKKTKGNAFDLKLQHQHKSFTFTLTASSSSTTTMPPPSCTSVSSPRALSTPLRRKMATPRAPSTAPAGRSPTKRKYFGGSIGAASSRRISAPFTRVDPPSFGGSSSASALPFSLDAALSGSLSGSSPTMSTIAAAAAASSPSGGATIAESMPKTWFFEIYQDTPEEEAANLMEHSTLTLDLSSDDEAEEEKLKLYRGKENTPPEGYDSVTASSSLRATRMTEVLRTTTTTTTTEVVRKKILAKDEMDDGERSPLSDLETEDFFPEGLSRESVVVVDEEKVGGVVVAAAAAGKDVDEEVADLPIVHAKGDVKEEIIVWEDQEDVL